MFVDLVSKPRTLARAALAVAYLGLMVIMTIVAWQGGKVDLSSVGQVSSALAAALLGAAINPGGSKKAASAGKSASAAPASVAPEPAAPGGSGASGGSGGGLGNVGTDAFWGIQTVVGCAALLLTALALVVHGSGHTNAPAAFVAVAAAFSALFLDTSSITHPLSDTPSTANAAHPADAAASAGSSAVTAATGAVAAVPPASSGPAAGAGAGAGAGAEPARGEAGAATVGGAAADGTVTPKAQIPAQSTGSADDAESPNS
ncbi:hypothetical protein [Streptacidiphilus neutrinimicus]|uniref:hypothetical protein n=1 Tax=Streptacidiphilus neutrinimicus TaxID=105420 RepID=UPI0005A5E8F2|nr:hypothetical protein [Streptacidiphilus neutrinimicus]